MTESSLDEMYATPCPTASNAHHIDFKTGFGHLGFGPGGFGLGLGRPVVSYAPRPMLTCTGWLAIIFEEDLTTVSTMSTL